MLMAEGGVITMDKLPLEISAVGMPGAAGFAQGPCGSAPETVYSLEMAESESIRKALAYSGGSPDQDRVAPWQSRKARCTRRSANTA
ncbi:hypothetical protein ACU4GD_18505 [Cupriavidus basilensis]